MIIYNRKNKLEIASRFHYNKMHEKGKIDDSTCFKTSKRDVKRFK